MARPTLAVDTLLLPPTIVGRAHPSSTRTLLLAVALTIAPFIVRRIILLGDDNYAHWMAIDYVARCISLLGAIFGLRSGLLRDTPRPAAWPRSIKVFLLLFAAEYAQQAFGAPLLAQQFRFANTLAWPTIPDPTLRAADLWLGLLFAVFVEEIVFRKLLFAVIQLWRPRPMPIILISTFAFALVHFTSGVIDTMLNAFVHGIFLGVAYWMTRRLSVCVAAHYLVDFMIFCGQ